MRTRQIVNRIPSVLVVTAMLALGVHAVAQKSRDGFWQALPEAANVQPFSSEAVTAKPQSFRLFQLDVEGFAGRLRNASRALDDDAPRLSFPLPDGSFLEFRVQETQTMSPALAEKNPHIRTYRGEAVEDPTTTVRFEMIRGQISALLFTRAGRFYVSPVQQEGVTRYIAYSRAAQPPQPPEAPACLLTDERAAAGRARLQQLNAAMRADPAPPGHQLRVYRLAVGATGEYTAFHGKTAERALEAIVTTISRVNEVYQAEVAVRFELVADELRLIKTDPDKDGYSNENALALADENQKQIDEAIGSAAYDIGHVFSTAPGGYGPGSACIAGQKARGATGGKTPQGDPFNIDYVAHELGHQLSANHTFNSTKGNCSARHASTAYEPGSGSTIMAYAGICDSENLQGNSSPYFHAASLEEIVGFVTRGAGSTCGTATKTSNRPPAVTVAQTDVMIPRSTPFELSGSAVDPDGDRLTYTWEQMDKGYSAPPNDDGDGLERPLFRSVTLVGSPRRTFPAVEHLSGNPVLGETLPAIARKMRFRLTARDGRSSGGTFGQAETRVSVIAAGPFRVTAPGSNAQWKVGTTELVTWDVGGTNKAPLDVASVRITLSTDGGKTYPHELLKVTANNGKAKVMVPASTTTQGSVRVEAVGGVFFNVSPSNLTIR
jgi:hypothetical protein